MKPKLIRITTVPVSMNIILRGQLNYMSAYFDVIGITGKDEKHFPMIGEREGIRMIPIAMERTISPIKDLRALWHLIKIFKREKPTIVHTHTPKAGLLGMLAAKLTDVPIRIHTVGGMPLMGVKGIKRLILNFTEKLTYSSAHAIWPNSVGLMNWIEKEKFCTPSKLKVIGYGASNGVDTQKFNPANAELKGLRASLRAKNGIKPEDIVFVFVGRIAKEKGMIEILEAFKKLLSWHKNVHIILVGLFEKAYGSLSQEEESKIRNQENIHFLGRFDDVRPYYAMSDVFLLPSYREGFPNALLEAGAMGLPSIVTDINGCNEVISKEANNGLLIKVADTESLFLAMKDMVENNSLRKKQALNAREVVVERFDNEFIWKEMLAEYKKRLVGL